MTVFTLQFQCVGGFFQNMVLRRILRLRHERGGRESALCDEQFCHRCRIGMRHLPPALAILPEGLGSCCFLGAGLQLVARVAGLSSTELGVTHLG